MVKVDEKLNESKRIKRELSYDIKKRIVNTWNSKKKENPKYTRAMLSAMFEDELGYKIANSTISDIVKNQDDILAAGDNIEFRQRTAQYPELEDCLFMYLTQLLDRKVSVSEKILIKKAQDYAVFFNITDFSFSNGWMANFKKRFNLISLIK